jgi:hypothetical protein
LGRFEQLPAGQTFEMNAASGGELPEAALSPPARALRGGVGDKLNDQ